MGSTVLVKELIDNFWFTTSFAVITKIVDKRVAGIHITLLASITNLSQFSHKFYIFSLVQKFGIFYPQMVLGTISTIAALYLGKYVENLDDIPVSAWLISDEVIL